MSAPERRRPSSFRPATDASRNPYEPTTDASVPVPRQHAATKDFLQYILPGSDLDGTRQLRRRSASGRRSIRSTETSTVQFDGAGPEAKKSRPKAAGGAKLDTYSGVFVPTVLNVLSILMFLRFGFLIGQAGVLGVLLMLIASYAINFITTFSLSAIASNGTVRGGGAYYLISRSLGPEFGGSIGVVLYAGFVFNTGLNAVGLIDCIKLNFGTKNGTWGHWLPESQWHLYLWSTLVLLLCVLICLAGSSLFARASNGLMIILLLATLSIPLSALYVAPFESRALGIQYTGLSLATFKGNFLPRLTRGAAGSMMKGRETFQDLFGILFPATGGIFAGASMSGDLKAPSRSIPKGTLYGLIATLVLYVLVVLAMGATITRASFLRNTNVIQETNMSGALVLAGEVASSLFSTLMGVVGSAKLLQALARDKLIPGVSIFGQGSASTDEPIFAILITYVFAQITLLCDLNQIASLVTMTYLMTFLVMNLACFLLKIGSAPNFRPSFHVFNSWTAFAGTLVSGAAMFFVDGQYATVSVVFLFSLFLLVHYTSPPKSWGDVSQSLIYHQVRKYLLRLRQEHVKFWRPQILLLVNDPRRQYKLIQFGNAMKKGSLYILGHVIVDENFDDAVPEVRRQQTAWTKFIDVSRIKAFVNVAVSPKAEWGIRNIVLTAGLGGMRPNIALMGFYNLEDHREQKPLIDHPELAVSMNGRAVEAASTKTFRRLDGNEFEGALPTDSCRAEPMMSATSYVLVLEDLLLRLQINVAIAKGFKDLEFPLANGKNSKKYIDLWPIQMSAEIAAEGEDHKDVLTTNFDTYTLILQMGTILHTVPKWKHSYKLRVSVFVEWESDVEEERGRVQALLENLRIEAEVLVFWLASGDLTAYEIIVNGADYDKDREREVEECLKEQEWWDEIQKIRGKRGPATTPSDDLAQIANLATAASNWPQATFQQGPRDERIERFLGLRRLLRKPRRKHTFNGLQKLGVNLGMRTHRLSDHVVNQHLESSSEDESDSSSDSDAIASGTDDGHESAASEGDIDDFEPDVEEAAPARAKLARRRSHGDSMRGPPISKRAKGEVEASLEKKERAPLPRFGCGQAGLATSAVQAPPSVSPVSARPNLPRSKTTAPKFSSRPVPEALVSTQDGPGPSIMFASAPLPRTSARARPRIPSAYRTLSFPNNQPPAASASPDQTSRRSSYSTSALPLSFNDLPSRAQHLILNELMRRESGATAVLFTTLPSPVVGTSASEEASVEYLGDLEVLGRGCPPVLFVHSNSMTVTTSL